MIEANYDIELVEEDTQKKAYPKPYEHRHNYPIFKIN